MSQLFSVVCCIAVLTCSSLSAILPPLYQGKAEIEAILKDPEFSKSLQAGEVIESIIRTEEGYEITTNHSLLQVEVEQVAPKHPGPVGIRLHFQPTQPR